MEYVYVLTVYEIINSYDVVSADVYIHKTYDGAKQNAYDLGLEIVPFPQDDLQASIEKKVLQE